MSKVSDGSPSVKSPPGYRIKNWSSYNRALVARGSLTVWIDDSFWPQWYDHRPSQRGAQFVYSDSTIEWMLTMRLLFGWPLRQTQGFIQSRRQGALAVVLPKKQPDRPAKSNDPSGQTPIGADRKKQLNKKQHSTSIPET